MSPAASIVVLDGEQRSALAVVRSLGRRGYAVHVGAAVRKSLAGGSRYAASESLLPDPLARPSDYAGAAAELVARHSAKLLLPLTDASILAVLDPKSPETGAVIPTGSLARFREASDKKHVLALAGELGIAVPAQWEVANPGDTLLPIPDDAFPLVLKPARSVGESGGRRAKATVAYARDRSSLAAALERLDPAAFPVLLQQRVTGPGVGVFLLRWNGATIASFAHRRVREFPPSGGVSVVCESVELPGDLRRSTEALLGRLDWSGVAMVEFKQDRETGRPFLMEVNPRFWGSLQLAVDAGVDFPCYLVQLALGEKVNPVDTWRIGLRSRWEWGEVNHLLARFRKSPAALDLPADAPGRLKTLAESVLFWRPGQRGAVLRLGDPGPFVRESVQWFRPLRGST